MGNLYYQTGYPMRIQARAGSAAEKRYLRHGSLPSGNWRVPAAIARGMSPKPLDDLLYHGGKLVPQMEFQNIYLGAPADWRAADIDHIDRAIVLAMQDRQLDNVMRQYFPGMKLSCEARESVLLDEPRPALLDEPGVQKKLIDLYDAGRIGKRDLDTTIFNLILPPGTLLRLDDLRSLQGLGGFHGSVHCRRKGKKLTLYYSANVYSQKLAPGKENGIAAFRSPWKNVVATLYHEINEFRTDPDVHDALTSGEDAYLGWMSRRGNECGDQPIIACRKLDHVFKEVRGKGRKLFPVQLMYSNVVHGAEGPLRKPHG